MRLPWILLISSVLLGVFGQLFMKAGMLAGLTQWTGALWVAAGISSYVLAMAVWVYVLSHFELSRAYPLLSLGYVLVYLGAIFWPGLDESFSWLKTIGILFIMAGVILVAQPSSQTTASGAHE